MADHSLIFDANIYWSVLEVVDSPQPTVLRGFIAQRPAIEGNEVERHVMSHSGMTEREL